MTGLLRPYLQYPLKRRRSNSLQPNLHQPQPQLNLQYLYPRLLKRSEVRFLCLECHADTPGVFSPGTPSFHNLAQTSWQNCTTCHVNIHGSNLSPVFFE